MRLFLLPVSVTTDNQNGTSATTAADHLYGNGGQCNISNIADKTDQRGVGSDCCSVGIRFDISKPFGSLSNDKVYYAFL